MTREPIYAALAALVFNNPGVLATFKSTGRFLRHPAQVPGGADAMPALYLVQNPGETHERVGKGMDPKRTLRCHFVMYFWSSSPDDQLPATQCNTGLDAIDDAINVVNNPSNAQTLGGLVNHVYTQGEVRIAEGLLQEVSVAEVPITILIP